MGDRLAELRRQRALISEHLAWLDREIERLNRPSPPSSLAAPATTNDLPVVPRDDGSRPLTGPGAAPPRSAAPFPSPAETNERADAAAARLLEEYRSTDATLKHDVRKGCLFYFIGAFVLLALGITVLYFTIGSR